MTDQRLALEALDSRFDAFLAEALGVRPPEDLTARIAARLDGVPAAVPRSRLLLAALLVAAGVAVAATIWWSQQPRGAAPAVVEQPEDPQDPVNPADPQDPLVDPALRKKVEQWIRDLELPERRNAALAGLRSCGSEVTMMLRAALRTEEARARPEVRDAIRLALADFDLRATCDGFGWKDGPFSVIADYSENCVVVVNAAGKRVWRLNDVFGCWDVELTPQGTMLITEFSVSRVREIDPERNTVWKFEGLKNPYDADRLPNGNTLIADTFNGRVIEVDRAGKIVWEFGKEIRPFDVDRLPNGNTLIADVLKDRVIEVSPDGEVVWEVPGMNNCHDADRLPNGNTLITLRSVGAVVEVDPKGEIVWRLDSLSAPSDADRLPNGNTIVAENTRVREFDKDGKPVWRCETTWAVEVNRY